MVVLVVVVVVVVVVGRQTWAWDGTRLEVGAQACLRCGFHVELISKPVMDV